MERHAMDAISKVSKFSESTTFSAVTGDTSSGTVSRSARFLYINSLMGRTNVVIRPHPKSMMDSLKQLANEAECSPKIKSALLEHVDDIEKVVLLNRKAGAMLNKTMMYWRMLLKPKKVDEMEVVKMIEEINAKMHRIKFKLRLTEEDNDLTNNFLPTQLFQCFLDDGLRIVLYDSNENLKNYIKSAVKLRKYLTRLQKRVFNSEYFDNVKDWVLDSVVQCYVIIAIDTVVALRLLPLVQDLIKSVKDGNLIETQFVNRLRLFNVHLHNLMWEAKKRRCETFIPFDDILAKMKHLDCLVEKQDVVSDADFEVQMDSVNYAPVEPEAPSGQTGRTKKMMPCNPVVLRNSYRKINPPELFPPFV